TAWIFPPSSRRAHRQGGAGRARGPAPQPIPSPENSTLFASTRFDSTVPPRELYYAAAGVPRDMKLPPELAGKAFNEAKPRRLLTNRVKIKAWAVVLNRQFEMIGVAAEPGANDGRYIAFGSVLGSIGQQFIEDQG